MNRRVFRWAAFVFLFLLAAALAAPKLSEGLYSEQIHAALESALGRKVVVHDVHFGFLTGPQFTLGKVEIGEDPRIGIEPFAYVETLSARPQLLSLFTGRLAFSSLTLEDAQMNLARVETGPGAFRWNFEPFLRPNLLAAFPGIHVRGGRINFKLGSIKDNFYLLDTDWDVAPATSDGSDWSLKFQGAPARTDRPARGFGLIRVDGHWRRTRDKAGAVDFDLQLEKSEIGDVVTLIHGEDIGLHGVVSGRVRLQGPLDAIAVNGRMRVEELHRWDQSIPQGEGWPVVLAGSWDIPGQRISMDAKAVTAKNPMLLATWRTSGYLSSPRSSLAFHANHFPVATMLDTARHLGAPVPENMQASGTIDGEIDFPEGGEVAGNATLDHAIFTVPGTPPLTFDTASMTAGGGHIRLLPATLTSGPKELVTLSGDYSVASKALGVTLASDGAPVSLISKQGRWLGVPLLAQIDGGRWKGSLVFQQPADGAGEWSGGALITGASASVPGIAGPLTIESGEVQIDGPRVSLTRMRGQAGGVPFAGEYRYDPKSPRPHRFRLAASKAVDAAELETLFLPALRPKTSLLALALRLGNAPVPEWLRTFHAEGSIQIPLLTVGAAEFERVRSSVLWDGQHIAFPDMQAHFRGGVVDARAAVELMEGSPVYRGSVRIAGMEWKSGKLDSSAVVESSGVGRDLLVKLRVEGDLSGTGVVFGGDRNFDKLSACYDFADLRLRLTDVKVVEDGATWLGDGAMQEDGRIAIQMSNGGRQVGLIGRL